jgi:uncharacterized damage-inducible protein DinB
MDVERIRALYEFNRWANAAVLDAVSALRPEDWTRDLKNSFPSVRDTLVHILWSEWIWLRRWKGVSPKSAFDPTEFATVDLLRTKWIDVEHEQADFVKGLNEHSLTTVIEYVNTRGESYAYPLWQMLQHVVNHSTYHRGQITMMLRQLGARPVATDFLVFYDLMSRRATP